MDWTDCPIIEQIPGKMSGAPVLRHSRMRPQDILANAELGAEWIAEAHSLPVDDMRQVLAFYAAQSDELPLEYIPPEEIAELGVDEIDRTGCSLTERTQERLSGAPVIRHTPVRAVDLLANRAAGVGERAYVYSLPSETVRSVLRYYDEHKRHLTPGWNVFVTTKATRIIKRGTWRSCDHIVMAVLDAAIHAAPQRGCVQSIRNGAVWMTSTSPVMTTERRV